MGRLFRDGGMTYQPPNFETADRLWHEITQFMHEQGGHYQNINRAVEEHIFIAIASGQFFYKKGCYFICYWKISDADVQDVKEETPIFDITNGDNIYVAECASKGRRNLVEAIDRIRKISTPMQRVIWHRPANHKTCDFKVHNGRTYGR
jgi:hypothetical protein